MVWMNEPQAQERHEIYHSKVEANILTLLIDAHGPLSRLEVTRKLRSDYPMVGVSKALDRLVRLGELSSYQQMNKLSRQRYYRLPDPHA
jgi:Fe2+ or Zn2+ uptake regulation protein